MIKCSLYSILILVLKSYFLILKCEAGATVGVVIHNCVFCFYITFLCTLKITTVKLSVTTHFREVSFLEFTTIKIKTNLRLIREYFPHPRGR